MSKIILCLEVKELHSLLCSYLHLMCSDFLRHFLHTVQSNMNNSQTDLFDP